MAWNKTLSRMAAGAVLVAIPAAACTVIEGDRITGADLAGENLGFAAIDPAADLGPAPLAGAERVFRASELERLADKHGLMLLVSAPPSACFERASQTLTEEMLEPLLRQALEKIPEARGASLEIVDFNRHDLPLGYAVFDPDGLSSSGLWRGKLVFAENRSVPIWARVQVAKADGEPIALWRTPQRPVIEAGDTVRVQVSSGGVLLAFEASAQSSGHVGELVMVRNPENGRRFQAVVDAAGKVSIEP